MLALAILPALLVGIVTLLARRREDVALTGCEIRRLWLLATAAAISHPLLDWMNTYGVRFLMPFDGTWFYGDTLFVVDPWFWLLCAAGVVSAHSSSRSSRLRWLTLAGLASLLVASTPFIPLEAKLIWCLALVGVVGVSHSGWSSRSVASVGLAALALYIAAMSTTSHLAAAAARAWLESRNVHATDVVSSPQPGNPLTWRVVATTPDAHRELGVRWLGSPRVVETGQPLPIDPGAAAAAARARAEIPGTSTWLRIPSYELRRRGNRCLVTVRDLRYSWSGAAAFGVARVELDEP